MPFPWKKATKLGLIPQLISDLKSKRNRSSLNLETGFPTSLADFVVKNRDRLKKSSRKQSKKSPPPRSDFVACAAEAPFVNPSSVYSPPAVTRQSPVIVESDGGLEPPGGKTEKDELWEVLGFSKPSTPSGSFDGEVDWPLTSQGNNRLREKRPEQLLQRLPPFKETANSSPKLSVLEGKRGERNKPDESRRRLPPRKEFAVSSSSSSSDNTSVKNPEKCNVGHSSSSIPENRWDRRSGKNRLEQPPPWSVRAFDGGADKYKPELLPSSNESRPEKDRRAKLLRRLPGTRLEVFVSSESRETVSPAPKIVSQSDVDGELPSLPIQRKLSVASMVFFVLVLALGTKEITLVMTVSVLLLFLLEFGRKYIQFCCNRRGRGAKASALASILGYSKEDAASEKGKGQGNSFREVQTESHSSTLISDSKNKMILVNTQDLSFSEVKEFESVNWRRELDLVYIENVSLRKEGSDNLKTKWKKLVKKKFRAAKGKKVCQDLEGSSGSVCELLECGAEREEEDEGASEEVDDESCSASEGTRIRDKNICLTRKLSVCHLVFFLLVLVGLVEGRLMALALTITWMLLIKSAEALWNKIKCCRRKGSQT